MILQGSQRGGAKDLALHLLKEENDHVDIHEIRGFVSDNLVAALNEAYAISRGTKAKQFLFSVSFNPPPEEHVSIADFENAISKVEKHFGFEEQPRAIVFHEKNGRRHAHAVWSRIDADKMKAIPLPFTKRDLKEISKSLFIEHGWTLPDGYLNSKNRDPVNFTLAEWQQAKRSGKNPKEIKAAIQDAWAISDNKSAFTATLKERGYILAKGDRRGFVVLDHRAEIYSVAKWTGLKAKAIRKKLGKEDDLPTVDQAKEQIANTMTELLEKLKQDQSQKIQARFTLLEQQKQNLIIRQRRERRALEDKHRKRQIRETKTRQSRFTKGLRGFWDFLTGRTAKLRKDNERDMEYCLLRDTQEKDHLIFGQLKQRQHLQSRIERLRNFEAAYENDLTQDITQYREIKSGKQYSFDLQPHQRHNSPKLER